VVVSKKRYSVLILQSLQEELVVIFHLIPTNYDLSFDPFLLNLLVQQCLGGSAWSIGLPSHASLFNFKILSVKTYSIRYRIS